VGVWGVLIVLTYVTVKATDWNLGAASWNLTFAMTIATVKGTLVALYFMHLRWDTPFNVLIFVAAMVFVSLFVILTLMDAVTYHPTVDPLYQPEMLRN
jgi:cytochrome c oxidase subunit 4